MAKRWAYVDGYTFVGSVVPQIFATQYFAPRKDFQATLVQDAKKNAALDWVSLTITAEENRALVLLCGRNGSRALEELGASIRRLASTDRTSAIVSYVFCLFENFVIVPSWWESLPKSAELEFR
jgi:hypothetical protein